MKKTKLFGLLLAMIVGIGFTACTEDEDAIIRISVVGEPNLEPLVGAQTSISYTVISDNKLDLIELTINNDIEKIEDFDTSNAHAGILNIPTDAAGTVIASIRVTDKKGLVKLETFNFTVKSNIETYTAVLLGSQESSTVGSFYSTSTDEVFNVSQAVANSAIIDFVYFFGANNKAAIAAPADADAQTIFKGINADWAKKNETLFKLVTDITDAEFTAISDSDAAIVAATADTELFLNRVALLAEGNIVAFVTDAGKKGLFKVSTIEGKTYGEESKITIEVKVQK